MADPLYFDRLGDKFDAFMSDYDVARRLELIRRLLPVGMLAGCRVLEVGCGTGRISQALLQAGARLTALDLGQNLAREVGLRLTCRAVSGNACSLPFAANSFDAVVSSECIEHTPEPLTAVREMARVCRPGGRLCLTSPNRLWLPVLRLAEASGLRDFSGTENWIWPGQATTILRAAGFGQLQTGGCHLWPFQLKFTRSLLILLDRHCQWLKPLMINFAVAGTKTA